MIPVNEPLIAKNARRYITDCLDSGWISSAGKYLDRFEEEFSHFIGVKYSSTCTSGTAALHLAMVGLGIEKDDEVIMPDLTIMSCALAALYVGAKPVFVDVEEKTGNIDPGKIEAKITAKTKAILVVHLYGHPADMDSILAIAKKYKLFVIEDAAEAHGAMYKGRKVGSLGTVGCFSFYANKIITSGEGGMVVTNQKSLYKKIESLKNLAHSKKRFKHNQIGFNYRMTNLQAALGVAQLEEVDKYLITKKQMAKNYQKLLTNVDFLELPIEEKYAETVFWMYSVKVKKSAGINRDKLRQYLKDNGVDTREFFFPLHDQPILRKMGLSTGVFPISDDLSKRGFYLPSGLTITLKQIETISSILLRFPHQPK